MSLSKAEALNLREDDVVLVPLRVVRTNNWFDKGFGTKVVVVSPVRKNNQPPENLEFSSQAIHSVYTRRLKVGDWVEWDCVADPRVFSVEMGRIVYMDSDSLLVKRRGDQEPRNKVFHLEEVRRILPPEDLTELEKKLFA